MSVLVAPLSSSKVTVRPSSPAVTAVTLVFSRIFSYRPSMRLCRGLTMSLSAPGMIWSINSTTVTLDPRAS